MQQSLFMRDLSMRVTQELSDRPTIFFTQEKSKVAWLAWHHGS